MKKALRPFVVEIKSGRRRTNLPQNSVWGTTDLKAMLREAENDAPHLFTPVNAPEIRDSEDTHSSEVATDTHAATEEPSAGANDTQKTADRQHTKRAKPRKRTSRGDRGVAGSALSRGDHPLERDQDELAILEEENRRLKWLLAEHLRQQNSALRAMLERFRNN